MKRDSAFRSGYSVECSEDRGTSSCLLQRSIYQPIFVLLFVTALFACFYRLGDFPLHAADEGKHLLVTQEMVQSGQYLSPTLLREPYFHKPPLRLWLSAWSLQFLGKSKTILRAIDASCGILLIGLVYGASLVLFGSHFAAAMSCLALLGCTPLFAYHGIRHAVPDALMLLLNFLSAIVSWIWFQEHARLALRQKTLLCLCFGSLSGLAILTKSAFGLFPLIHLVCFLFLFDRQEVCRRLRAIEISAALVPLCLIPGWYFAYHSAGHQIFFGHEILGRATTSLHRVSSPMFYFEQLLVGGDFFGGGVLILSAILLYWAGDWRRQVQFLVCGVLVLLILGTLSQTRLLHYMYPALPLCALLIGAAGGYVRTQSQTGRGNVFRRAFEVVGICLCLVLTSNTVKTITTVSEPEASRFEKFIENLDAVTGDGRGGQVALFRSPPLTFEEQAYLSLVHHDIIRVRKKAKLERLIQNGEVSVIIASDRARDKLIGEHWLLQSLERRFERNASSSLHFLLREVEGNKQEGGSERLFPGWPHTNLLVGDRNPFDHPFFFGHSVNAKTS